MLLFAELIDNKWSK